VNAKRVVVNDEVQLRDGHEQFLLRERCSILAVQEALDESSNVREMLDLSTNAARSQLVSIM